MWSEITRCWVATSRGDLVLALQAGRAAIDAPRSAYKYLAHCTLAEAYLSAGDPNAARNELLDFAGGPDLAAAALPSRVRWYGTLARTELALGRTGAAESWVLMAEDIVAEVELPERRADVARARAAVLLACDRPAEATAAALAAVHSYESVGMIVDAARAELLAARALLADGHREAALERCIHANVIFATNGARGAANEAASELRRVGVKTISGARPRPHTLRAGSHH